MPEEFRTQVEWAVCFQDCSLPAAQVSARVGLRCKAHGMEGWSGGGREEETG